MKKIKNWMTSATVLSALIALPAAAHIDIPHQGNEAYVSDRYGNIVRDGWDGCVRTIHWTKTKAIAECEGKKTKPKPKPAPIVVKKQVPKPELKSVPTPAPIIAPKPVPAPVVIAQVVVPKPAPVVIPKPEPKPKPAPTVMKKIEKLASMTKPLAFSGFFKPNQANLTDAAKNKLDDYVEYLNFYPQKKLEIKGYTDSRGNANYNQRLSEKRANAVQVYLEQQGIDSSRLTSQGLGEENPVASNDTAEGRKANRRVELELKD